MVHTGFAHLLMRRCSTRSRCRAITSAIRAQKNAIMCLPGFRVRDRLTTRAKLRMGSRPFIVGHSTRLETVTNVWRRRLAQAFEAAGPFEQKPTPPPVTPLARRLLQDGNSSIDDVAMARRRSEKTVALHYSAWVPERQERLTRMFKKAYDGTKNQRAEFSGGASSGRTRRSMGQYRGC